MMQRGAWGVAVESSSCRREATRALKSAVEAVYEEGSATGILSGAHRTGSGRSLGDGDSHVGGAKRIGGHKREKGWTRGPVPWREAVGCCVEHPGAWNPWRRLGVVCDCRTAPSRAWPCSRASCVEVITYLVACATRRYCAVLLDTARARFRGSGASLCRVCRR